MEFLGFSIVLWIAAAIYLVATAICTEILKKWWAKSPLFLSWAVGLFFYVLLIFGHVEGWLPSIAVFIVLTAVLNGSYKFIERFKSLIRGIAEYINKPYGGPRYRL